MVDTSVTIEDVEVREVVASAQTDQDVVDWLRGRADWQKLVEASDVIRHRNLDDVDRQKFAERYPIITKKTDLYYLMDILDADDAEMFAAR